MMAISLKNILQIILYGAEANFEALPWYLSLQFYWPDGTENPIGFGLAFKIAFWTPPWTFRYLQTPPPPATYYNNVLIEDTTFRNKNFSKMGIITTTLLNHLSAVPKNQNQVKQSLVLCSEIPTLKSSILLVIHTKLPKKRLPKKSQIW